MYTNLQAFVYTLHQNNWYLLKYLIVELSHIIALLSVIHLTDLFLSGRKGGGRGVVLRRNYENVLKGRGGRAHKFSLLKNVASIFKTGSVLKCRKTLGFDFTTPTHLYISKLYSICFQQYSALPIYQTSIEGGLRVI